MALPVAGDDPVAKKVVMDLVNSSGFDPVDAGSIDDSWRRTARCTGLRSDADANGVRRPRPGGGAPRPLG